MEGNNKQFRELVYRKENHSSYLPSENPPLCVLTDRRGVKSMLAFSRPIFRVSFSGQVLSVRKAIKPPWPKISHPPPAKPKNRTIDKSPHPLSLDPHFPPQQQRQRGGLGRCAHFHVTTAQRAILSGSPSSTS